MPEPSEQTAGKSLWVRVQFKNSKVWVRCDASGEPIVRDGTVELRYNLKPGKVYSGSARNVRPLPNPDPPTAIDTSGDVAPDTASDKAKAKPASKKKKTDGASDRVPEPRESAVVVHTDGACSGNPGPAGYGVVLAYKGKVKEHSVYLGKGTNNIAELTAIKKALESIKVPQIPVDLYTDSDYAIGVLTRGWKAKANADLIAEIRTLVRKFPNLRILWVPGHAGVPGNERADELARLAISERRSQEFAPA